MSVFSSGCPEIRTMLKEVLALEGSTAILECTVVCSPAPTISWLKENKPLSSTVRFDTKFDSPSGKATLSIKNCGMNDMGDYKCNFRNPLGEAETTAKLTIKSKCDDRKCWGTVPSLYRTTNFTEKMWFKFQFNLFFYLQISLLDKYAPLQCVGTTLSRQIFIASLVPISTSAHVVVLFCMCG